MNEILSKAHVALGANLPHAEFSLEMTLSQAIATLSGPDVVIRSVSRFFSTPCFPPGAGPDYVNAAIELATSLSPTDLLDRLHAVEHEYGRARLQRWGMRTLDLDVLSYDDQVLPDLIVYRHWADLPPEQQIEVAPEQMILPHPRLQDRAFVLVPLADIAPKWRHPVSGRTVADMLHALPADDIASVTPL